MLVSAIIVVAVALVSFNLDKITGQPVAGEPADYSGGRNIEFFQNGVKVTSVKAGSTGPFVVKVSPSNPTNSMKLGYSITSERLHITGPGVTNMQPSNYKCQTGRTSDCKEASVSISPGTHWNGDYVFTIKQDRDELGSSTLRVN